MIVDIFFLLFIWKSQQLYLEDLVKLAGIADAAAQAAAITGDKIIASSGTGPATPVKPDNIVIDTPSRNGTTPLHVAAGFDSKNAVDMLLKFHVQVC